ncbi:hypothetical protein H5410_020761 [Solanum commersonii]|uniref:Uncharacterized protein n=1 Tax=Solanum commersonii TaxID=4109 RepID=A0A9J5ZC86_SOLCO|nr:hypothetical protein H5410_020761 [Solanum commersonii]
MKSYGPKYLYISGQCIGSTVVAVKYTGPMDAARHEACTNTSKLGRGSLINVAGGLAGGTFWLSVYPTDVIKSVIQVDDYKNPKFSDFADAFKRLIVASEGIKGLWIGYGA